MMITRASLPSVAHHPSIQQHRLLAGPAWRHCNLNFVCRSTGDKPEVGETWESLASWEDKGQKKPATGKPAKGKKVKDEYESLATWDVNDAPAEKKAPTAATPKDEYESLATWDVNDAPAEKKPSTAATPKDEYESLATWDVGDSADPSTSNAAGPAGEPESLATFDDGRDASSTSKAKDGLGNTWESLASWEEKGASAAPASSTSTSDAQKQAPKGDQLGATWESLASWEEKDGAAGSSASSSSATQKQKKTDQLGATWESLASWETDSDSEASGSTAGRAGPGSSGSSGSSNSGAARVERLKLRLLSAVASLDRGLAATAQEARQVDELAAQLEDAAGSVQLYTSGTSRDLLKGTWRLLYTSGFNTGSLGGRRPGPPAALVPLVLGQVYQRVDPRSSRLDNIVEFLLPVPSLPNPAELAMLLTASGNRNGNSRNSSGSSEREGPPAARLTLKHDYEIQGNCTVKIVYEDTSAELVGAPAFAQLPKLDFPQIPEALRPPRDFRAATFDVVFLDETMRVTRGDRGELRVYLRDQE